MKVGVEASRVLDVGHAGYLQRLDYACAGAACGLPAEGGPLVAVQLQQRQTELLADVDDLLHLRVDEHPTQLHLAAQARCDALPFGKRAGARSCVEEDHAHRPSSELDGQLGVL